MSTTTLFSIQQNIGRYGLSILFISGNIGNLFTVLILGRSTRRRRNSCSLYLLAASISNWIVLDTGLIFNIIGIDHTDPQHTSNIICKLRWSTVHALLMLSRSFMIAACIDRWALSSSNITIRSFSRLRTAIHTIIILVIVWTILPIHMIVFFNNNTGRCSPSSGTYAFFYAIYSLIIIGILPLLLMIVFSTRAWYNLQRAHNRVLPENHQNQNIHMRKRDRDLLKMLSGEVFLYCLTTIPYPINQIYSVSTSSMIEYKDPIRLAIESLIGYIISPFLNFMYCCAQFYIYMICSHKFRKEFRGLFRRPTINRDHTMPITHHALCVVSKNPKLVQTLSHSDTIQITSGFKVFNTRIQAFDDHSSQPLVTISDNEHSDNDDHFMSPVHKLTKEELCEELQIFTSKNHTLLAAADDDDDLQFRTEESLKQSLIDILKREQGHFDAECILFIDLNSRNITDANSLSICRNIIILNLNNNQLTNIRTFGVFTQLKILSVAQNQLTSLDGLQTCENLEVLNVAGNDLTGLKSLAPLLQLTYLRSLCLFDRQNNLTNPLCNTSSYQQDVKNNLPNLDILDNEWLGQGFQERLSSLESTVKQLENPYLNTKSNSVEKPTIIVTKTFSSDGSIQSANEEYEQFLQSIRMLVN
ncbi:hypothetical protein I4U23_025246 [Adineta vaga]|nr:hypothetical protein I4U23_025246 [Adineta vaga]